MDKTATDGECADLARSAGQNDVDSGVSGDGIADGLGIELDPGGADRLSIRRANWEKETNMPER